ncbi:MAG: NAD(P)H-hydrate dehydratase [Bacteroidota bacterium]
MQTLLSAEEMQRCDSAAVKSFGIHSLLLMENAGLGVARWIQQRFPLRGKTVAIFCGKGNNGGDGLVAARHLANAGARVKVVLLGHSDRGDAAINAAILRKVARAFPDNLSVHSGRSSVFPSLHPDIIVDAIFGTGFSGNVRKQYAAVIEWINRQSVPRIAIDIPSGIHGTTGVGATAVKADTTLTLGAMKYGLLCNNGRDSSGTIQVLDIGIPTELLSAVKPPVRLVGRSDVKSCMPVRSSTVHKYSAGKVFILGGSRGYTGAAVLAATSALRMGAGAVVLGVPESIYPIVARKVTEVIVEPLPSTAQGSVAGAAMDAIMRRMDWADTVVLGPGLSQEQETTSLVRTLVLRASGNVLLDADAITSIAKGGIDVLKKTKATYIVTPHVGEFSRMTGLEAKEIEAQRIQHARAAAKKFGIVVVLKGAPTVTATPEGSVFVNSSGNPGMATVGTGDVLSGMIAGLWAQGADAVRASYGGAFLHGLSGDLAAGKYGERSIVASDLIECLPEAIVAIEGDE